MAKSSNEPDHGQQPQASNKSTLKEGDPSKDKFVVQDHHSKTNKKCIQLLSSGKELGNWNNLPLVALTNIFGSLDPSDRLRASSTCHSWRNVIYHSSLWPNRNLQVNLCSHKFAIPAKDDSEASRKGSGFYTYTLHNGSNGNVPKVPPTRLHTHKTFNNQLKLFVAKCSPFLAGLTIYFDPNSSYNVIDTIKILKHFSENEMPIYELNPSSSLGTSYANCRNLKSLMLRPITPLVRSAFSERFMYLYYGLTEAIRYLLSKCKRLEELCLGDLHELVYSTNVFLRELSRSGSKLAIRRLQLSSIKGDVFRYMQPTASLLDFYKFTLLCELSIDFDVLDGEVINKLSGLIFLRLITINVHRFNRHHPGIEKDAWTLLNRACPQLTATVNLLHTESNHFDIVVKSLLATDLPIKCFRAYYLELRDDQAQPLMCNLLETLAARHSQTLETALFIDHIESDHTYLKSNAPNAFVMFTWRCRVLLNLTIIGLPAPSLSINRGLILLNSYRFRAD